MTRFLPAVLLLFLVSCSNDNKSSSAGDSLSDSTKLAKAKPPVFIYPYMKGHKWGYADSTGKIIIKPDYEQAYSMCGGYAVVAKNNSTGIIDSTGKVVVDFKYDYIDNCVAQLAVFTRRNMKGLVNMKGEEVLPPVFKTIYVWDNGMVTANDGKKEICYNRNGKVTFEGDYERIFLNVNSGNQFLVKTKEGKFGMVDSTNKVIIPLEYDLLNGGMGWKNYLIAVKDKKYGIIDMKNNIILPLEYDFISFDETSGLIGTNKGSKYGLRNIDGREIFPMEYSDMLYPFLGAYIPAVKDKKYGMVDTSGKVIIPFIYEYLGNYSEGLIVFGREVNHSQTHMEYGFIDLQNDTVIPLGLDYARRFKGGLAQIASITRSKSDNYISQKEGYIDKTGKVVIPCVYESANDFFEPVTWIKNGDSLVFINKAGKEFREN